MRILFGVSLTKVEELLEHVWQKTKMVTPVDSDMWILTLPKMLQKLYHLLVKNWMVDKSDVI